MLRQPATDKTWRRCSNRTKPLAAYALAKCRTNLLEALAVAVVARLTAVAVMAVVHLVEETLEEALAVLADSLAEVEALAVLAARLAVEEADQGETLMVNMAVNNRRTLCKVKDG